MKIKNKLSKVEKKKLVISLSFLQKVPLHHRTFVAAWFSRPWKDHGTSLYRLQNMESLEVWLLR